MPETLLTKRVVSSALKELMTEKSLDRIRVGDIVKACEMNRQNFYYHFKDKYDLVNWLFLTEFNEITQDIENKSPWDNILLMCEFFYRNRKFYQNALQDFGQNSFSEYFNEIIEPFIRNEMIKLDFENEFHQTFFTDAILGSVKRWIIEGAKIMPEDLVELFKKVAISAT